MLFPPPAQFYSPPKKDFSWIGLPKFSDDTVTDYSRPSPTIESTSDDVQNRNPSVTETEASPSTISSKPFIKFVKASDRQTKDKTYKVETAKKPTVKATLRIILMTKAIGTVVALGTWLATYPIFSTMNHLMKDMCLLVKEDARLLAKEQSKQNSVLFIDSECIVLGRDFKLIDDTNVLLRTPRQHNTYSINLNNIIPHKDLTCLVAKVSADECMLWHKRLCHLNIKIMNRLVRHNLAEAYLPNALKITILVLLVRKESSIRLLVRPLTGDFSRFTWTLFFKTKDETSGILRNFITEIENLKELRVKIIRCDNGGEFRNKEMNDFCSRKGTKEAAGQDVKKDVSSLRYIVLPNWFHETYLETSTSNAQDACNADAPKSSGNSNPTATSTNPLANHMETLAVETPIPTVSSPVPTACLNDSPELSNILGVTTNTDDTNEVEADLGNMETTITASPTTTFRIHKDHPKSQIIEAMQEELLQFKIQNVWSLVDCHKGIRPIGIKWVLKNKKDERGIVIRNKAMLVAQGHTQEERIDYDEVFAPVARNEAIRLFLAYASFMGFIVYQIDVKSAFLYGTIDEEVYVMQPPGFQDSEFPARVYKVKKAMGTIDQTLFIRRQRGDFILIQVYVDDIIFGSSNPHLCREFKALMHEKFQMSAMRKLNFFLGLQVLQKKDGIFLSQDKYGKDGTGKDVDLHLYRSMIGSLMYLTALRPDIMFAVCACARHQVTPKECHLHAVKRIFRYLNGHPKLRHWLSVPCEALSKEFSSSILLFNESKLKDLLEFLTFEILWYDLSFIDKFHTAKTFDLVWIWLGGDYGNVFLTGFNGIQWIKTTEEGTKILANVDGKLRTVSESFIRRNLKLNDKAGISSLPDAELFENHTLMGYNISPNQKFTFQKGQFFRQWKYLIHTILQYLSPKSIGFNEFSSNISTATQGSGTPTEPHHTPSPEAQQTSPTTHSSPSLPPITAEPLPTIIPSDNPPLRQYTRRARIAYDSTPWVPSLAADEGSMQQKLDELMALCTSLQRQQSEMVSKFAAQELEIINLKARVKLLKDKDRGGITQSRDNAPIKGRSLDEGEEAAEKGSDNTEEMVTVLTSLDAATVLSSGFDEVPTSSGSIPTAGPPTTRVPTGSKVVPTISPIFTTATESTPYTRRKGKEKMIARDAEIAIIHVEEELQMMIDGLDRNNETTQQRKPLTRKQQREFYTSVLRNQAGWKAKHFNGMTLEEIKEKFDPVWKQIQDFIPISSKEESKRLKKKGIREDLNQLWAFVKESLSLRPTTSDKEMELWVELKRLYEPDVEDQLWTHTQNMMHAPVEWKLYDMFRVHHVISKDEEMFMLVEKDYPLRKGLAIVMISYKLQVENYSQMANDLILNIHKIANNSRQQDD
uniref:Uncharacterized protein n=1 Tax=Tanacetum cinerariifolium TaxID=118510 RepID=A0A6L2NB58_TANCI|nr:hypothetical protein [Tanacetum cinerariifolium]